MERVHGVRRVSKVLVEAQEPAAVLVEALVLVVVPVVEETLRTPDLS
jgi:hypothetical protein